MPSVVEAHVPGVGEASRPSNRGRLARARERLDAWLNDAGIALPALLLFAFVFRAAWIDQPPGGLIFDEAYYVNASRVILGIPVEVGAHYADSPVGLDPNVEHPPLGKLVMAASMSALGDGPLGWRLPSLVAGLIAIAAVYLIVRAAGESAALAFAIAGFAAFDNLMLVHGRIGTLDMLVVAPMLVGALLALRERWLLAGALFGLGFLVKLSALYGLAAVGLLLLARGFVAWRRDGHLPRSDIRAAAKLGLGAAVVGLVGLWLLDLRFTTFASPLEHLGHMITYGTGLKEPIDQTGICAGSASPPWQWLFNDCPINYLRVNSIVRDGDEVIARIPTIDFRGVMNPLLMAPFVIGFLASVGLAWRSRHQLAAWAVVWALAGWLPYVLLVLLTGRVTYIFYFLPIVPAAAVFLALLLWRSGLPRWIGAVYAGLYLVGFMAYFPFRQIP